MTGDEILRAQSATRRFGDFTAVDAVTMAVRPGEVVGLLGANGAGKTTLIRLLLGLLAPTEGAVELLGGPPDRAHRARMGYVPQNLGLYRDLTVAENLSYGRDGEVLREDLIQAARATDCHNFLRRLPQDQLRVVIYDQQLLKKPSFDIFG